MLTSRNIDDWLFKYGTEDIEGLTNTLRTINRTSLLGDIRVVLPQEEPDEEYSAKVEAFIRFSIQVWGNNKPPYTWIWFLRNANTTFFNIFWNSNKRFILAKMDKVTTKVWETAKSNMEHWANMKDIDTGVDIGELKSWTPWRKIVDGKS